MRIDVVGKHVEVTEAIRAYAEQKASKLPKFFDGTQRITVTLAKEDSHAGRYLVEMVVDVEKHKDFVSKSVQEDLYAAIDDAANKSARQLSDFKERLKVEHRSPSH